MRILFVSQYYYPESFKITDICEELARRKHEITVLTGFPNYPGGEIYKEYTESSKQCLIEKIKEVRVIRCPIRPRHKGGVNLFLNYFSYVKSAKKFLKHFDETFDAIVVFEVSPVFQIEVATYYAKKKKIPIITMCQDIWPEVLTIKGVSKKSIPFKLIKKVSGKLYRKSTKIIVSSPSFKNYLTKEHNVDSKIITYIPQHGSQNLLSYNFSKETTDKTIFLYAGNIGKAQNVEIMIKSFEMLKDNNFQFWIVGNGSEYENCKKYIEEHELTEKILLLGWKTREELLDIYKSIDVLVLSLTAHSFVGMTIPTKLQDYLAIGKPIIAAIEGDARAVIEDAQCGLCSNADDVNSFLEALQKYMQNKLDYKKMGNNGRNYFLIHFKLEKIVDQMEEVITSSISNPI